MDYLSYNCQKQFKEASHMSTEQKIFFSYSGNFSYSDESKHCQICLKGTVKTASEYLVISIYKLRVIDLKY